MDRESEKTSTEPVDFNAVTGYLQDLQERVIAALRELDPDVGVRMDRWHQDKPEVHGDSRALQGTGVFEKGGVNFSRVHGSALPDAATRKRPELAGQPFDAAGISLVLHPCNPYVPATHANLRFFQVPRAGEESTWWFGGGLDLTPCYGFKEDARHWHRSARDACLPFGDDVYPRLKKWCDEYFYLPHRKEMRGIGGLFFDDWNAGGFGRSFEFIRSVGDHLLPAYLPIVRRRRGLAYHQREREFQLYRRGRYVEFNLLYDRGTLFGLQSGGRTESILMSLPPLVRWCYDWQPDPGSAEERLCRDFLRPRDWLRS